MNTHNQKPDLKCAAALFAVAIAETVLLCLFLWHYGPKLFTVVFSLS